LCNALLDLLAILEARLGFEGFSKAVAEVIEAEWIFSSKV
jgi:hypothetical protein